MKVINSNTCLITSKPNNSIGLLNLHVPFSEFTGPHKLLNNFFVTIGNIDLVTLLTLIFILLLKKNIFYFFGSATIHPACYVIPNNQIEVNEKFIHPDDVPGTLWTSRCTSAWKLMSFPSFKMIHVSVLIFHCST